jgi:hypothetical protein
MGKQQEEIDNRIEQLQFIIDADRKTIMKLERYVLLNMQRIQELRRQRKGK